MEQVWLSNIVQLNCYEKLAIESAINLAYKDLNNKTDLRFEKAQINSYIPPSIESLESIWPKNRV